MNRNLDKAVRIVKSGGIIIFPTDTAYGIGCRVDDKKAIQRLFKIRKRPQDKAVPVLASSIEMLEEYVQEISPEVRSLMEKYWPGGLTLVLNCKKDKIPGLVRGGGSTIGIRIPAHQTVRELIKKVGVPILAPSANFSGERTPFKMLDLDPELARLVDFVLPGKCSVHKPSTVVDVTQKPWKILRSGAVKIKQKAQTSLKQFHAGVKRFEHPHQYPVGIEKSLFALKTNLILKTREVCI